MRVGRRVALQAREAGERDVGRHAEAVDRALPGLEHERCDRSDPWILAQRSDQPLQAVGTQLDVVVEQDHVLALTGMHPAVDGAGIAVVGRELDDGRLRPVVAHALGRAVTGAVIDDDHAMGHGLACQMRQAVARQRIVVVDGNDDVDRGGHGAMLVVA